MKYFIKTFGCQMNESDSERIAGFLEMHKIKPTSDVNKADLVIFNTCGVRQMAEDRVYGQIHNIRKQESVNSEQKRKIIILTGCLADRKDVRRRLESKVDLFCNINNFPKKLKSLLGCHPERLKNAVILSSSEAKSEGSTKKYNQKTQKADSSTTFDQRSHSAQNDGCYLDILPKYTNPQAAYVPIMTGCNNFCSYCVVPYARGPEVSRPTEDIIKEIKTLVKNGCREIILLGQNVNSYKYEASNSKFKNSKLFQNSKFKIQNYKTINFSQLLGMVDAISSNFWIWFVSNHPKDFSDELINTMAKCQKVCECVHLPIQAGDNKVLQNMNRKYTAQEYLRLIKKIRTAFKKHKPNKIYSITSDIIVGFPGETKKQFLESAKVMEKVGYDMVFFGQFSPRPGTAAWNMKDNIPKKEKSRREKYLNEILKKTTCANNRKYVGKIIEALIDNSSDDRGSTSVAATEVEPLSDGLTYFGHTRTYKNIKIKTTRKNLVGKIVKAKITKANNWNLEGSLIK